jgi:hypothetical protein
VAARVVGFIPKGLIIALGRLARKRTHKFIQQRLAARFRFAELRIRNARSHDVEIAPSIPWTPRRVLACGRVVTAAI